MFKRLLEEERSGIGGIIMIFCGFIIAFTMNWCFCYTKITTSRSVAESVEHICALQALASCYVNNTAPFTEENSNRTFKNINGEGALVDPVEQFNTTMKAFGLLNENADGASMAYHVSGGKHVFVFQINPYVAANVGNFGSPVSIQPEAKSTIIEAN